MAGHTAQPAKVMLHIKAVNNRPFAFSDRLSLAENNTTEFTLKGRDIDYDKLSFFITKQPLHGTLSGVSPTLTYTPDTDYFGSDSFEFVSNDATLNSAPAKVNISVKKVVQFSMLDQHSRQSGADIIISKDGTKAFVAGGYGSGDPHSKFTIIDISDALNPKTLSFLDWEGYAYSIAVSDDETKAYVTDINEGLRIIDISDVANPKELSLFAAPYGMNSVQISADGNRAYLGSSNTHALLAIDVSDAKNPKIRYDYLYNNLGIRDIALSKDGKKIYYVNNDRLYLKENVDTNTHVEKSIRVVKGIKKVLLSPDETKLYALTRTMFIVYDVKDSDKIKKVFARRFDLGIYETLGDIVLSHDGNVLFIAVYRRGIIAIDAKDYVKIGTYDKEQVAAGAIAISPDDSTLYTADYNDGFNVISVELP